MNRVRVKIAACIASLLMASSTGTATGDTIIRKSTTYFSIGGVTASDLDRELMRRGPLSRTTGRRHPGATQIKFNGSATFVSKDGRCRIGGAKVSLSTKIMLPKWSNRRKAGAQMGLLWDTLSSDIRRHEERHAEIARSHARELEKTILALAPAGECGTLKAKVNRVSEKAMAAHDADQMRFDRIEAANFENRMIRLLKYKMSAKRAK